MIDHKQARFAWVSAVERAIRIVYPDLEVKMSNDKPGYPIDDPRGNPNVAGWLLIISPNGVCHISPIEGSTLRGVLVDLLKSGHLPIPPLRWCYYTARIILHEKRVYADPTRHSPIVRRLKVGSKIRVYEKTRHWLRIADGEWIYNHNLLVLEV